LDDELHDCARCGEDACVISYMGIHMARVRRSSFCKEYRRHKPSDVSNACRTEVYGSRESAVAEWNEIFGKRDAA
jgi:hypothetical protein